jgi:hypothetical protein
MGAEGSGSERDGGESDGGESDGGVGECQRHGSILGGTKVGDSTPRMCCQSFGCNFLDPERDFAMGGTGKEPMYGGLGGGVS